MSDVLLWLNGDDAKRTSHSEILKYFANLRLEQEHTLVCVDLTLSFVLIMCHRCIVPQVEKSHFPLLLTKVYSCRMGLRTTDALVGLLIKCYQKPKANNLFLYQMYLNDHR